MVVAALPARRGAGPAWWRTPSSRRRPGVEQPPRDAGLSAARGRRQHQQEGLHSRFSSCSRNFSSSPFMAMTRWVISAIVRLGAHRVHLPPQLLGQEAELLARRPIRGERVARGREVGAEAHQLLGDVELVGEERQLLRQPLLVDGPAIEQLAAPRPGAGRAPARSAPVRGRPRLARPASSRSSRCRSSPASTSPSLRRMARHSAAACATTGSTSVQPTSGALVPVGREDLRLAGHRSSEISPGSESAVCSSRSRATSALRPLEIDPDLRIPRRVLHPARLHRQMPAVEVAPEPLAKLALERGQLRWQPDRQVEVAVVHGPDLEPKPAPGHRSFRGTEPRHAERHASSECGKAGKCSVWWGLLVGRRR